jgi:hypothetical protein
MDKNKFTILLKTFYGFIRHVFYEKLHVIHRRSHGLVEKRGEETAVESGDWLICWHAEEQSKTELLSRRHTLSLSSEILENRKQEVTEFGRMCQKKKLPALKFWQRARHRFSA